VIGPPSLNEGQLNLAILLDPFPVRLMNPEHDDLCLGPFKDYKRPFFSLQYLFAKTAATIASRRLLESRDDIPIISTTLMPRDVGRSTNSPRSAS